MKHLKYILILGIDSLGSCGEYLFGYVGGIRAASPSFKTVLIDPTIGEGLTWAKTSYISIHGLIATYWKRDGRRLRLRVVVPANTTATVCVPTMDAAGVTDSGGAIENAEGLPLVRQEKDKAVFEVRSGAYSFGSQL